MNTKMSHIYIKYNEDWIDKLKYGYVYGIDKNLINRLNDSKEEHSELSNFTNILLFKKTNELYLISKKLTK